MDVWEDVLAGMGTYKHAKSKKKVTKRKSKKSTKRK